MTGVTEIRLFQVSTSTLCMPEMMKVSSHGAGCDFIGRASGKEAFKLTELGAYPLSLVDGLPVANRIRTWQYSQWTAKEKESAVMST